MIRVHRGVAIARDQKQAFREGFKKFLEERLDTINDVVSLKQALLEFYERFTGKSWQEKEKKKKEAFLEETKEGTLKWLIGLYLENARHRVTSATMEINYSCAKRLLRELGSFSLKKLTTSVLLEYQTKRKAEGVSNRTVNMEIGLIRKALNWALDVGLISGHNIKKFPMLPEHKKVFYFLTPSELKALLHALEHHPILKARVLLSVLTGLRPKEIAVLEWKDIDFENGLLFVRKKPGSQVKDREERVIPLGEEALRVLRELKVLNPSSNFVFGKNGKPVFEVHPQLRRASKRAKLEKLVSPYMLRHTFAVMSLRAGVDIFSLKELMGHSSLTTTERYLHTDPEHIRVSVERLAKFLKLEKEGRLWQNLEG
ncbi:MAG: site-specific integrase [Desulfurococcaceae archaeon]